MEVSESGGSVVPLKGGAERAAASDPAIAGLQARIEELEAANRELQRKLARDEVLRPFQVELLKLQRYLEDRKIPMVVIFEGRDAAGKGGAIRRITRYMNEKHYQVVALGKPTEEQRNQWYFQRYIEHFPTGGKMVVFDRSWYNRAMVEPVFGFCTDEEYEAFLRGVVGFEKDLARQGMVLIKLYFSVSKEEQARRFKRRKDDPLRQWKLSEVDLQAQDHWDAFTEMKYQMLKRTSTIAAPWTVIRSEDKQKARLNTMKVLLNALPYPGRDPDLDFAPDPEIVISGARELEWMEAQRISLGKFTR
jgi:polyphosphate kinase 2